MTNENLGYDYGILVNTLIKAIYDLSDGLQLIESASVGEQPAYPFCQYTITSPYIAITQDVVEGEQFEVVISLTWRALSGHQVLNLGNITNKYFRSQKGRFFMQENGGIVVVSVQNSGLRDTFISIEYERSAGIDLRLRVTDSYSSEIQEIENISFTNENEN
ncbi:hypothetical protein A0I81_10295 [Listeria monocytogenes]|uniref:phage neck terminator protein n=1 Tax=Listeria monocytogenes TaxID=1639 RepID=UPI000BDF9B27|nr:hypothetical protein [Listeria monocytogenes]EAE2750759.1 hypothetical protein [Listeria monocytogenes]EAE4263371.1 hypothetical protein [Listeria monocytogenes]EAE4811159.1 hypothetical protein [Listeria monocytogenes]EAE5204996.1 hypothetical protein [Listeria monocytogenes]EAE5559671.1 hypothetical protein [Listeria monocytogenes]